MMLQDISLCLLKELRFGGAFKDSNFIEINVIFRKA